MAEEKHAILLSIMITMNIRIIEKRLACISHNLPNEAKMYLMNF